MNTFSYRSKETRRFWHLENTALSRLLGMDSAEKPGAHGSCVVCIFISESGPGGGSWVPQVTPLQELGKLNKAIASCKPDRGLDG